MTLNEFLLSIRKDIDDFENMWKREYENNPYNFPLELPNDEDWLEQFLLITGEHNE